VKILNILTEPWALSAEKLGEVISVYGAHIRGPKIDFQAIQKRMSLGGDAPQPPYDLVNGVAVIQVQSVLTKGTTLFSYLFGGTSMARTQANFQQAISDPSVRAVVLHVDSPGGSVDGTQELANAIFQARGQKPIIALADGMMASAAYWVGSAADRVYMTSDTTVMGSIGVVAAHVDVSKAEEQMGVKVTEITAGEYKRIASNHAPLSQEGRNTIQDQVDQIYEVFLGDVAKHLGTSPEDVHARMANGRTFMGKKAIEAGLADGVSSLSALVGQLAQGGLKFDMGRRASVEAQEPTVPETVGGSPTTQEPPKETLMEPTNPQTPEAADQLTREEIMAQGAAAERQRIADVRAQSIPGHEDLIEALAFDGKTTGPEAAVAILSAERTLRASALANLQADAPKPLNASSPEQPKVEETKEENPSETAEKARKYQAEQKVLGHSISAAEAVAFVTKEN
jgi:signal peptide peptidase SppA